MNPARLFTYLVMRGIQLFDPPILRTKGLVYDSEAARRLRPGDILLWRGSKSDPLAAAIMLFTDSPYSHAELYMGGGWSIGSEVNGVGYNPAMGTGRNLSPPTEAWVDVVRYKGEIDRSQLQALLGAAESQLDKPYGIVDGVLGFPWPGKRSRMLRSTYASYGCSELVVLLREGRRAAFAERTSVYRPGGPGSFAQRGVRLFGVRQPRSGQARAFQPARSRDSRASPGTSSPSSSSRTSSSRVPVGTSSTSGWTGSRPGGRRRKPQNRPRQSALGLTLDVCVVTVNLSSPNQVADTVCGLDQTTRDGTERTKKGAIKL